MYHLTMANVPPVVHVSQVGNPCHRGEKNSEYEEEEEDYRIGIYCNQTHKRYSDITLEPQLMASQSKTFFT